MIVIRSRFASALGAFINFAVTLDTRIIAKRILHPSEIKSFELPSHPGDDLFTYSKCNFYRQVWQIVNEKSFIL